VISCGYGERAGSNGLTLYIRNVGWHPDTLADEGDIERAGRVGHRGRWGSPPATVSTAARRRVQLWRGVDHRRTSRATSSRRMARNYTARTGFWPVLTCGGSTCPAGG